MKKTFTILWIALATMALSSCGNNATEEVQEETSQTTYSYDASQTEVGFTAYKFTKKAGVGGTFGEVNITGNGEGANAIDVIAGMKFSIPTSSLNTNDEGRDAKILQYFFGTLNTETITGEVESINEDENTLTLAITMNNQTHNVVGEYTVDGDDFSFLADINVEDWSGAPAIEALNEVCKDLHTGEDGVSKLWPDVTITFKTKLSVTE